MNRSISKIEEQLLPETKKALVEQLKIANRVVVEHKSNKLEVQAKPTEELFDEQKLAAEQLESIAKHLKRIALDRKKYTQEEQSLVAKQKAIKKIN